MPIANQNPQQWSCNQCTWRHHSIMNSDVLVPPPESCPQCGGAIVLKPATVMGQMWALWRNAFRATK